MAKRLPERKLNPWGATMYVAQGDGFYYETDLEMIVAVRLNLVPIGVEVRGTRGGWAWLWLELPAGFDRPEQPDGFIFSGQESGSEDAEGMPPDEDG